jgi:hypothetical protein
MTVGLLVYCYRKRFACGNWKFRPGIYTHKRDACGSGVAKLCILALICYDFSGLPLANKSNEMPFRE